MCLLWLKSWSEFNHYFLSFFIKTYKINLKVYILKQIFCLSSQEFQRRVTDNVVCFTLGSFGGKETKLSESSLNLGIYFVMFQFNDKLILTNNLYKTYMQANLFQFLKKWDFYLFPAGEIFFCQKYQ